MPDNGVENLLARLVGRGATADASSYAAIAATTPDHSAAKTAAAAVAERQKQDKLDQLLGRIAQLTSGDAAAKALPSDEWFPPEPSTLQAARLGESAVEELVLKYLLARGDASGREITDQLKLPFVPLEELLRQMKADQW